MEKNKEKKFCYFCKQGIEGIDYKDTHMLRQFINVYKKILPSKRTGVCSWHQRKLSMAVKRSRTMALLPFTNK
ncbi:MAG: 30S ribosomal protein S18 [bacterium]